MGQYYTPVILGDLGQVKILKKEFIRVWLAPFSYGNGLKLMEHSYIGNKLVSAFETLICPEGAFYMSRVVWAGDYADPEPGCDDEKDEKNLSTMAYNEEELACSKQQTPKARDMSEYRYIVNHTKCLFVDKQKSSSIHPLPLLTCEGNGRGGGDYHGTNEHLCGTWARDVISVEIEEPEYVELDCVFGEN